jgi:hypothetical protein
VIDVEGFTPESPIAEEDWDDMVAWEMRVYWSDRWRHNDDGYLCEIAGSPACLALGHVVFDEDGMLDEALEDHPTGWDGDSLCPATKYDTACTTCEGPCQAPPTATPAAFWKLFAAQGDPPS